MAGPCGVWAPCRTTLHSTCSITTCVLRRSPQRESNTREICRLLYTSSDWIDCGSLHLVAASRRDRAPNMRRVVETEVSCPFGVVGGAQEELQCPCGVRRTASELARRCRSARASLVGGFLLLAYAVRSPNRRSALALDIPRIRPRTPHRHRCRHRGGIWGLGARLDPRGLVGTAHLHPRRTGCRLAAGQPAEACRESSACNAHRHSRPTTQPASQRWIPDTRSHDASA